MEIFRYSSNAYGQQVLEGISYDLLWVFAGIAAAIIVVHCLYMLVKGKNNPEENP